MLETMIVGEDSVIHWETESLMLRLPNGNLVHIKAHPENENALDVMSSKGRLDVNLVEGRSDVVTLITSEVKK